MNSRQYSFRSFFHEVRQLRPVGPLNRFDLLIKANRINEQIQIFLEKREDRYLIPSQFRVGVFDRLGQADHMSHLQADLRIMLKDSEFSSSLPYWAVYYEMPVLSDHELRLHLDHEIENLSAALGFRDIRQAHASGETDRIEAPLSYFVLHPQHPRADFRFPFVSVIFYCSGNDFESLSGRVGSSGLD